MRECKKCGEEKPHTLFVKSKACKFGVAHTYLDCSATRARTVYNNRYKEAEKKRSIERNKEEKLKVKEYLGGEYVCADCGYTNKSSTPFDFHHVDPLGKERTVSQMYRYSWDKIKEEVDKCVLLCACCHRLRHDNF